MRKSVDESLDELKIPAEYKDAEESNITGGNGKIIDLVLPLAVLIAVCIYGMLYTGGIHEGKSISDAFADCDASNQFYIYRAELSAFQSTANVTRRALRQWSPQYLFCA